MVHLGIVELADVAMGVVHCRLCVLLKVSSGVRQHGDIGILSTKRGSCVCHTVSFTADGFSGKQLAMASKRALENIVRKRTFGRRNDFGERGGDEQKSLRASEIACWKTDGISREASTT